MWVERGECEYGKCDDCGGNGDSRWKDNFLEKGVTEKGGVLANFSVSGGGEGNQNLW